MWVLILIPPVRCESLGSLYLFLSFKLTSLSNKAVELDDIFQVPHTTKFLKLGDSIF